MDSFSVLLLWVLARLRPVLWLHTQLARLIAWAIDTIADEDTIWSEEVCAWFGGWLWIIESRLNEYIHMRACDLLDLDWKPCDVPAHTTVHSVRMPIEALERLERLAFRFHDIERLARLRAQRIAREMDQADPLAIASTVSARPCASSSPACGGSTAKPGWGRVPSALARFCAGLPIRAPP